MPTDLSDKEHSPNVIKFKFSEVFSYIEFLFWIFMMCYIVFSSFAITVYITLPIAIISFFICQKLKRLPVMEMTFTAEGFTQNQLFNRCKTIAYNEIDHINIYQDLSYKGSSRVLAITLKNNKTMIISSRGIRSNLETIEAYFINAGIPIDPITQFDPVIFHENPSVSQNDDALIFKLTGYQSLVHFIRVFAIIALGSIGFIGLLSLFEWLEYAEMILVNKTFDFMPYIFILSTLLSSIYWLGTKRTLRFEHDQLVVFFPFSTTIISYKDIEEIKLNSAHRLSGTSIQFKPNGIVQLSDALYQLPPGTLKQTIEYYSQKT